ncbi:MAG: RnfABCDGE type electron transport complex subunit D [Clostridia bacterium]|nr:RnfABCDGE type electron transport complex subunit D [Clostridia bacterium]
MAEQKKKKSLIAKSQSYFGDYLFMLLALCVPAVYYCGRRAVFVLLVSIGAAVFCDLTGGLLFYNKILLRDLCAVFTGTAVALMMPPTVPYYIPALASAFAIFAVKIPFGGSMKTPVVPAAAGFAFVSVCFPGEVFSFPVSGTSATGQFVSGTSLAGMLQKSSSMHLDPISVSDILTGSVSGPMGTACAVVLLGCAVFLLLRRPRAFISTMGFILACSVMALMFPRVNTGALASLILEICSGSLLFAAVFFVTDPATCPRKPVYALIYGVYSGVLCMVTRYYGIYEESVCFAVITANCSWPVIQSLFDRISVNGKNREKEVR